MYGLHKAFLAEMAKAPAALLSKFISEKLAAEGHAERPGFVEAFTKHLLGGGTEPFDWDDGSGDDVIIAFTDADTKKLDELTKEFVSALPDVVTQTLSEAAKAILEALKRDWPGQAEFERESLQGFRRRLEARWGKGFDGLRMLLTMVREMGGEVHARARRSRSSKNQAIRSILLRLHTRACQVTAEIITLMENGFADGAMARWRTLYEIGVVATVISDGGDELAQRYMAHEAVESKLALDEYDRCHQALGFKPMSLKERRRVERAFKAAVDAHGPEFGKPYGWAAQHLGLKRVTFKELEDAADRSEMRSYYKMASYNVHADAKGVFHRLGVLGDPSMVIAGASDAGFVDPGQNTAIALVQITALLFRDRISNLDIMIRMQLLILVRDEIPEPLRRQAACSTATMPGCKPRRSTKGQGRHLSRRPLAGRSLAQHRRDLRSVVAPQGRPVCSRKWYAALTYQSPRTVTQRCLYRSCRNGNGRAVPGAVVVDPNTDRI